MALTATAIKNAAPGNYYGDGNGLYLQVSNAGTKSWIFRFQLNGKRREMGLGAVDVKPMQKARAEAANLKVLVSQGIDPIDQRAQDRADSAAKQVVLKAESDKAAHTFAAVAVEYIDAKSSGWSNGKHSSQWGNTLDTYAAPIIGNLPVSEITTEHILEILKPIWKKKTVTASRLRGRIEAVLKYAKVRKWRTGENPAAWKENLAEILPEPSKVSRTRHHPALPWETMSEFMAELRTQEGLAAKALEFGILTAARSGEVRGALWQEIDLNAKTWIIPAERMKADREHRAVLSDDAIAVLEALPRIEGEDLVFPSPRARRPLSDMTLAAVIRRMNKGPKGRRWVNKMGEAIVPHGFRSSFKDWAGEATHYPNEMTELALAHAIGNKVEEAYRRGDMLSKRFQLMEDWAVWCQPAKGAKVVSIQSKTAA